MSNNGENGEESLAQWLAIQPKSYIKVIERNAMAGGNRENYGNMSIIIIIRLE